jgi:hypothetical protein
LKTILEKGERGEEWIRKDESERERGKRVRKLGRKRDQKERRTAERERERVRKFG